MCHRAVARLQCSPTSVKSAREFVTDRLHDWGVTMADSAHDRLLDATLVTSELVTNATKFSTTPFEVSLVAHRDHLEVAVTDDNPQPARLERPEQDSTSGRGLLLVSALAYRWGQFSRGGHKTVWALLSIPPGSSLGEGCTAPAAL